jgi:hypothetical protein
MSPLKKSTIHPQHFALINRGMQMSAKKMFMGKNRSGYEDKQVSWAFCTLRHFSASRHVYCGQQAKSSRCGVE